jgi:hypothetical protein
MQFNKREEKEKKKERETNKRLAQFDSGFNDDLRWSSER